MILFAEDWDIFPSAVVDSECSNQSFLDYASLLKAMGVKNWQWPLALLHRELRGVNPFEAGLSKETRKLIAVECKLNPWYYFRSIARVPGSTLDNPIVFGANRSNMMLFWLYFNHVTVCLAQLRQTGKTFAVSTLDSYLLNVRSDGGRTILLTKDEGLRAKTLAEIKTLEELLPTYLKQHGKMDIGNREEINVSSLDNNYKAFIARNDPIAADKTGRGHTVENVRIDEAAYLYFIQIAMRTLLAATTAARRMSILRDNPYGNILTTTAGKKDERDGKYMYEYFNNGAPWTEFFFDAKNQEELHQSIITASRESKYLRVHASFSHRQLGYTDEWLIKTARENDSRGEAFERDYLNIWTSGSQRSPFSTEDAKRMRDSQMDVQYMEISPYGCITIRWYLKEDVIYRVLRNEPTVMSVDTSDAIGRDEFAITFLSVRTGKLIGVCTVNEINLITVAQFLVDILKKYERVTMINERRNQATAIVDHMHQQMILLRMDPFRRIYNTCVQDQTEFPERFKNIQVPSNHFNENFLAQHKKFFGFATSASGATSRTELYSTTLNKAVRYVGDSIYDKSLIDQILSLVVEGGRVDHPSGGRDDICVSWLLAIWFLTQGRHLQYYGIQPGTALMQNDTLNSKATREEQFASQEARRIKIEIDRLLELVKNEKDPYVTERLIFEIENLKSRLGPQHEVFITTDTMLHEIMMTRNSRSTRRSMFS